MARFDVFQLDESDLKVVEVQADLFGGIDSSLVIPLLPSDAPGETFMPKLHPELMLGGVAYRLLTSEMSSLPRKQLGQCLGTLAPQRDAIVEAIDFYLQGF